MEVQSRTVTVWWSSLPTIKQIIVDNVTIVDVELGATSDSLLTGTQDPRHGEVTDEPKLETGL